MKIERKNVVCACCGKESEQSVVFSYMTGDDYGLDGRPDSPREIRHAQLCDSCGYSAARIDRVPVAEGESVENEVERIKQILAGEAYQKTLRDEKLTGHEQAMMLKALLEKNKLAEAMDYLHICWQLEFDEEKEKADKYRILAVNAMMEHFEVSSEIREVLVLIDCLRQLGEFEDADKVLKSIAHLIDIDEEDDIIDRVWILERKLVNRWDNEPHFVSEA